MKTHYFIALLFLVADLSAKNGSQLILTPEVRGKQLENNQKYSTAYELFTHGEKTGNAKLLNQARIKFEEIVDAAFKDPQAVSVRILLGTKYHLGCIYYNVGAVTEDDIISKQNFNKARELLLPVTQAGPEGYSPEVYAHSCYLMANIYWWVDQDTYVAERFFRKAIAYYIQHPELKRADRMRPIFIITCIALAELLSSNDDFLKEALSLYQDIHYDLARNPITHVNKAAFIKSHLNDLKSKLLRKMHARMPETMEEQAMRVATTQRPRGFEGHARQDWRL